MSQVAINFSMRVKVTAIPVAISFVLTGWGSAVGLSMQGSASRSIWDGVYTAEQAARGETAYLDECARCHEQALAGTEWGPALIGDEFLSHWNGMGAGRLFQHISRTMPPDAPGRLGARQSADILSYVLKMNEFPAGEQALEPDIAALNLIRIDHKP